MKAIILPVGKPDLLNPLTTWLPEFLLPVVNKPIVEHLIELLVRHNIRDIILILKHMPYETEQYLGSGQKWGASISYSLERDYEGISSSLNRIRTRLDESFLCLPGNIVTNIDISDLIKAHERVRGDITISKQSEEDNAIVSLSLDEAKEFREFYPFIMTPEALSYLIAAPMAQDLEQVITSLTAQGLNLNACYSSYNIRTVHSLNDFLEANKVILRGELKGIIIPGKQTQPGIWIGRQSKIHPDARIYTPSLIGSHCNIRSGTFIGEDTVIGDNVIVDRRASIEGSIILGNTYIGSHTEIKDSVIRKNSMINVPRLLNVYVGEDLILGDLDKKVISRKGDRLFNLIMAIIILLLFSPIITIRYLYNIFCPSKTFYSSEERFGSYEVVDLQGNMKPRPFNLYAFRSKSPFIQKLPGLFNVIKGDMNLVGNSPLTHEEVDSLKEVWETLRFKAPMGLIHLWEVEGDVDLTWEEKIVTENYYSVTRSFWGDIKILLKGFLRI